MQAFNLESLLAECGYTFELISDEEDTPLINESFTQISDEEGRQIQHYLNEKTLHSWIQEMNGVNADHTAQLIEQFGTLPSALKSIKQFLTYNEYLDSLHLSWASDNYKQLDEPGFARNEQAMIKFTQIHMGTHDVHMLLKHDLFINARDSLDLIYGNLF